MTYTIGIKKLADGDYVTVNVDRGLKQGLEHLTIEWAQQSYNETQWEPRPWPSIREDENGALDYQEEEAERKQHRKGSDELIRSQRDPYRGEGDE